MALQDIELFIGRLVTDEEFRVRFYEDPVRVAIACGLRISAAEIQALAAVPQSAFDALAQTFDERLLRRRPVGRANRWFTKPRQVRPSRYPRPPKA